MMNMFPPALVLNADYTPLQHYPLKLYDWQNAVDAVIQGRVNVVEEYPLIVHSPSMEMFLPSVVALRNYQKTNFDVKFTRHHVFLRDNFTCQYCGDTPRLLSFDHVTPQSRGGRTTWENIVTACHPCNRRKANHTCDQVGLHPRNKPRRPSAGELRANARKHKPSFIHETWYDYLKDYEYWNVELEK